MSVPEDFPLQVNILIDGSNTKHLNKDYVRIFTQEPGFAKPIFSAIQYPSEYWLSRFCGCLTYSEAVELYNHYLIWEKSAYLNEPQVILYNHSHPLQPDKVIAQLIKGSASVKGADIIFYGKYLDRCDEYKYEASIIISKNPPIKFTLYQTVDAHGAYAYLINPSGARILIDTLTRKASPVEPLINCLLRKCVLKGLTYHPSIIGMPGKRDECQDPSRCFDWTLLLCFALILLIVGLIILMCTRRK